MSSLSPVINSINPASGPASGGTAVTIFGQNFVNGCKVKFGGVDSPQVTFNSGNQLTAVTPQGSVGPATVRVVNPGQVAGVLQNAFVYVDAPPPPVPVITSVAPASGPPAGGTAVTIFGQNFVPGCQAKFGGESAQTTTFINGSQLSAVTPPGQPTGPVTVRVLNPGQQQAGVLQSAFTYVLAPPPPQPSPVITSANPSSGPLSGGTQVTITGQNFAQGCEVRFGGNAAQVLSNNPNALVVVTPQGSAAGVVNVRVVNPGQQAAVAQNAFNYTQAPPPPASPIITSVQPASGPTSGNTQVTIFGQNFAQGCQVKFGGTPAQITLLTDTALGVITPPTQTAGPATVRVVNPDPNQQPAVAQNAFSYVAAPPPPPAPAAIITSVNPSSGPLSGGTQVTLTGQNFAQGCQVKFEGNLAQVLSNTPTRLVVSTPPAAAAGPATVRVINPNQQPAVAQNAFTYAAAPTPTPTPAITSLTPSSGPLSGGTQVTIKGQNFAQGCQVKFGGADAQVNFIDGGRLNVVTPPVQTAGPVNVRVVNPGQQAAVAQNAFSYVAAPPPPSPGQPLSYVIESVQIFEADDTPAKGPGSIAPAAATLLEPIRAGQKVVIVGQFMGPPVDDTIDPSVSINPDNPTFTSAFNPKRPKGNQDATLTIRTTLDTPPRDYTITVGGNDLTNPATPVLDSKFKLTVLPAIISVTLEASPNSQKLPVGGSVNYNVTVTPKNYGGVVELTKGELPAGVTGEFKPPATSGSVPQTAVFTLTASAQAKPDSKPFTVNLLPAVPAGVDKKGTSVKFTVEEAASGLKVAPGLQTITPGKATSYTVTALPATLTTPLTLSVSAAGSDNKLPPGVSASFFPATIKGGETSTLTVNTLATTPIKEEGYLLEIRGKAKELPDAKAIAVLAVRRPMAELRVSPFSQEVTVNKPFATETITLVPNPGDSFPDSITLKADRKLLPAGVDISPISPPAITLGQSATFGFTLDKNKVTKNKLLKFKVVISRDPATDNGRVFIEPTEVDVTIFPGGRLTLEPADKAVKVDDVVPYTVTLERFLYDGPVTFDNVEVAPPGGLRDPNKPGVENPVFVPNPTTLKGSRLTADFSVLAKPNPAKPNGDYTLKVTASSPATDQAVQIVESNQATLSVSPKPSQVDLMLPPFSVQRGTTMPVTLDISRMSGAVNIPLDLTISGMPLPDGDADVVFASSNSDTLTTLNSQETLNVTGKVDGTFSLAVSGTAPGVTGVTVTPASAAVTVFTPQRPPRPGEPGGRKVVKDGSRGGFGIGGQVGGGLPGLAGISRPLGDRAKAPGAADEPDARSRSSISPEDHTAVGQRRPNRTGQPRQPQGRDEGQG